MGDEFDDLVVEVEKETKMNMIAMSTRRVKTRLMTNLKNSERT